MFCKICQQDTQYHRLGSFTRFHLRGVHNISPKEYYDLHMRLDGEGVCYCGRESTFRSLDSGYQHYCSTTCASKSECVRSKISESFKHRDIDSEKRKRSETCLEKYGVSHISKCSDVRCKVVDTNMRKYGYVSNLKTSSCYDARWKSLNDDKDHINEKRKQYWTQNNIDIALQKRKYTCLEKYGVHNVFMIDDVILNIREFNVLNGNWLPDNKFSEYESFRQKVRYYTNLHKDELYAMWDGIDYYTQINILDLYEIDNDFKYQPTIDHKISIHYGFINNISIDVLSDISNLCICGRGVNASKNIMCENEFKIKLKLDGLI